MSVSKENEYDELAAVSIRWIAGIFAVCASGWGAIFLLTLLDGNLFPIIILSPAYAMTAGYWWRTLGHPTRRWRRAIWGLSLVIQGGFSCLALWSILQYGIDLYPFYVLCVRWWWITAAASLLFLRIEPPDVEVYNWRGRHAEFDF